MGIIESLIRIYQKKKNTSVTEVAFGKHKDEVCMANSLSTEKRDYKGVLDKGK